MKLKHAILSSVLGLSAAGTQAANISVDITNLTGGITFTPLLVTAHTSDVQLFNLGEAASAPLQAMAEGGAIDDLVAVAEGASAISVSNPAQGMLPPGMPTSTGMFDTGSNDYLSIVAMVLPSNDGFVGLNSWKIPSEAGTYTVYLNAYDAGTEANDEVLVPMAGGAPGTPGMPGIPGGQGGTGATGIAGADTNTTVHIHRGNLGDSDPTGGASDVNSSVHRWLNPVAKAVITVQ